MLLLLSSKLVFLLKVNLIYKVLSYYTPYLKAIKNIYLQQV